MPLQAAQITWATPTDVTGELTDFSSNGDFHEGYSGDNVDRVVDAAGLNLTFVSSSNLGNGVFNADPATRTNADYDALLQFASWGGGTTEISLGTQNPLFVGAEYEVTVWLADTRGCCANRQKTYGDGQGNNVTLNSGNGDGTATEYIVGTFTADGQTQPLAFIGTGGADHPQFNAIMVRQTVAAPDEDDDGLVDAWETQFGLATDDDGSVDVNNGPDGDPDNDGSTNLEEFQRGTIPNNPDTDDDGVYDGAETKTGTFVSYDRTTNMGDTGTDPLEADTDGDTWEDGVESGTGTYVDDTDTGTDPNKQDTDGDGAIDNTEVPNGRDPNDPNDGPSGLALGLLSYWNFDAGLTDVAHTGFFTDSGVADDGTFVGLETDSFISQTGLFGGALEQNGGDGHVEVTASADTLRGATDSLSVSTWFKVTALDSNWQTLLSHGEGSQWRIARRSSEPTMSYAGGAGDIPGAGVGPAIDDGEWHHLVSISDPVLGQTALYIDGALVATGGTPNIEDMNNGEVPNLWIGANPQSGNREWNGFIDDLAIWNRPLTEEEIQSIYNGGIGASIGALLGGGSGIEISSIVVDGDQVTLTWSSTAGATYSIYASTDLENWDAEMADGITGESGSTSLTFTNPAPEQSKLFFRVEPPRPVE